jgi:hypothetical protein
LQLEKPRPLLRSGLLGKLGVWVGPDCFEYRGDSLEALRIGQSFGLEPGMLLDIGEGLSAVGPLVGGILRRQVLTRQFDSGLALGHLLKGLETASSVAQACGVEAPLLAACRDTWAAAETRRDWPAGITGGKRAALCAAQAAAHS